VRVPPRVIRAEHLATAFLGMAGAAGGAAGGAARMLFPDEPPADS